MRSSAVFRLPRKGFISLKYWLFRLGLPREQPAADIVKKIHRGGELSVCLDQQQMPALKPVGWECFVTGGCFSSCWRRVTTKQLEKMGQVRRKRVWRTFNSPQAPGPCVLWHETLQEKCDIKGNKGICDQIILVWRILIGLLTQRSSNTTQRMGSVFLGLATCKMGFSSLLFLHHPFLMTPILAKEGSPSRKYLSAQFHSKGCGLQSRTRMKGSRSSVERHMGQLGSGTEKEMLAQGQVCTLTTDTRSPLKTMDKRHKLRVYPYMTFGKILVTQRHFEFKTLSYLLREDIHYISKLVLASGIVCVSVSIWFHAHVASMIN